jgi:carbamoyl-phosphate synthase large subunit
MSQPLASATPPPKWRVLVFPGGTEIGLEIRQALAQAKEVELFSAGADLSNHAPFVFQRHFCLPLVNQPGWFEALQRFVAEKHITHIFPAHDELVTALSARTHLLGAKVITSPAETCALTRSKTQTLQRLSGIVPTPRLFTSPDAVDRYPVFVKPDRGQGAQGASRANNRPELDALLAADPTRIILEYLPGDEFTVDCFSDRERGLLYASGRQRRRIRAGIAMDSVPIDREEFGKLAHKISEQIPLWGAWFYQLKADAGGTLRLLEVAPRVGGTSCVSRVRGVNLPLLSLYEAERIPVNVIPQTFTVELDRALVNRYRHTLSFSTVYVDLDDTLIVRGRVNSGLVRVLFDFVNQGKRLILITRHAGDLYATLNRHRLNGLFDEVIHLKAGEPKSHHISESNALFIDDSFKERQDAATAGVIVMDPGMTELLADDRI